MNKKNIVYILINSEISLLPHINIQNNYYNEQI